MIKCLTAEWILVLSAVTNPVRTETSFNFSLRLNEGKHLWSVGEGVTGGSPVLCGTIVPAYCSGPQLVPT